MAFVLCFYDWSENKGGLRGRMEGVLNPCTSQIANEMEANYKSSKHIVVRLCVCVCAECRMQVLQTCCKFKMKQISARRKAYICENYRLWPQNGKNFKWNSLKTSCNHFWIRHAFWFISCRLIILVDIYEECQEECRAYRIELSKFEEPQCYFC